MQSEFQQNPAYATLISQMEQNPGQGQGPADGTYEIPTGVCLAQPTNSQTEADPCAPSEYPFIGTQEATLCRLVNLTCDVEVGVGTPITHSSQLGTSYTGNVCVKGDFHIDNNFKFINSVVKIEPGATILVLPPSIPQIGRIFTIDNSKLFACDDMWNGIKLSHNTTISTKNNTVIEDAVVAIKADNIHFSVLLIENTTFNRNEIGILLMQDPTLPSKVATIARFNNNKFLCTSPLNGTADQITFAGIKTVGVPVTISPSVEAFHNLFEGLQYGIIAEGVNTTISGRFFRFRNLRRDGIKMDEGSLTLRQSLWHNCEEKGVNIALAHKVDIRDSCLMTINTDIPAIAYPNYREGVYVGAFGLNSSINLSFGFLANLEGTTTPVRGVHLKGGNVGAGTKIIILQSSFTIRARASDGIFLDGSFPASTETHVFANLFATGSVDNPGGTTAGMRVDGNKNNLNIYANYFTGNGYFNYAIRGSGSTGVNNYIADNYIEGTQYIVTSGEYFSKGFFFNNFQNTTFCSNTNYFGSNYAFEFWGTNTGTDFLNNKVYATAVALDLFTNSLIGPQSHKGNEWHPVVAQGPSGLITFRAAYHARCQTPLLADASKFTVHTDQSVWNGTTGTYDFFSKYHPENIEPDMMDEFFEIDPTGTPSSVCIALLTEPGGGELDKTIADDLLQVPAANPSMGWIARSYLYKKLKENPELVGTYAAYSTFLADHADTNIGHFYEVNKKIADAFPPSETLDQQSREILDDIEGMIANLTLVDSLLENSQDDNEIAALAATKFDYLEQLIDLQVQYNTVYASYKSDVDSLLQEALAFNQQITPAGQLESNEKAVTGIWLESVLNQDGNLTESQIDELKGIGQQCPETGGLAVHYALVLLPECEKAGLSMCISEPVDDLEPLFSYASGGQRLMAPASSDAAWLYPNPTGSVFYVELPDGDSGELLVSDLTGKIILVRHLTESGVRIEINEPLASGIYLVRIRTNEGRMYTNKLIIQSR